MFHVFCDNKGCHKEMSPVLDKADNKVYCTECGQEIHCVTEFAKNQMVSLGMVKRESKKQQAFSVKCNKCSRENPPKLKKDRLHCAHCDAEIEGLSAPFSLAIKDYLKAQGNRSN